MNKTKRVQQMWIFFFVAPIRPFLFFFVLVRFVVASHVILQNGYKFNANVEKYFYWSVSAVD